MNANDPEARSSQPPRFTSEQKAAIEHSSGPLLIIAGAGTGKTLVITHRIAHLIAAKKAKPHEILALTFTEKAASEMEERVDCLTPYGYTDVVILTFHAFGDRLLREFGLRIGLPPDFRVLSQPEQAVFFRRHLFDFPLTVYRPLGNPMRYIESLLTHISRLKDEAISPAAYQASADRLRTQAELHPEDKALMQEAVLQQELAATYQIYQRLTLTNQCIDFGDQVYLALDLLRSTPAVLQKLPYRYVLVDEFQDTNPAQFQLIQLLSQHGAEVTVVGDDDQSIYRFRGAAIANIQRFTTLYPNAAKVVLTQNFRSRQMILDAAYRLIQHNNPNRLEVIEKVDKHLHAAREILEVNPKDLATENEELHEAARVPVRHIHFDTLSAEADWVAKTISDAATRGERYGDFAILVRKNAAAEPYIRALNLLGIPHRFTGNQGLFNRHEIRLMIAFMRAVMDREDSPSVYFLLSSDLYRFPLDLLSQQMNLAKRSNRSLYIILDEAETLFPSFQKLKEDLDAALKRSLEVDAGVVLYEFIKKSGFLTLSPSGDTQDDTIIQNIARFFGEIKRICQWTQAPSLPNVVGSLDLLREAGEDPPMAEADFADDAVWVMTVHRAKGLEFDTVFMVGLQDGGFPARNRGGALSLPPDLLPEEASSGNLHMEEERRLFYVGITRARNRLLLTSAQQSASGEGGGKNGGGRPKKVSPFVMEALDLPQAAIRAVKTPLLAALEQEAGLPPEKMKRPSPDVQTPLMQVQTGPSLSSPTPLGLTYYQMDDYLTCPMKYKYIHVLRVPIYPHHTIVYGSIMHKAVAAYLRARQEEIPFTAEAMLRVFEDGWKSEGYLSRAHEDQRMAAGRRALLQFYEREERSGIRPTSIEKEFSFPFEGIKIKGRWDRMDTGSAGSAIIDYKTSEVSDPKAADKKARESMQLTLYAWAYRERASCLPEKVVLYFLESGLIGTATRDEGDIETLQKKVRQVASGIREGDFTARPTYMACSYCAYQDICPYTASA